MKFIAQKKVIQGGFLVAGDHLTTIVKVVDATPSHKDDTPWSDPTPQIEVNFKSTDEEGKTIGALSKWYNLVGFQKSEDFEGGIAPDGHEFMSSPGHNEEYLVNSETSERVPSESRTADAIKIFCELAETAGIEEGAEFNRSDLTGKEVGVHVEMDGNKPFIQYTMYADKVKEAA